MSSGPNYYYTWNVARPPVARVSTSRTELQQIGIAYGVLTLDLVLIFGGVGLLYGGSTAYLVHHAVPLVLTAAAAALTGFVAHELAHKVVAQRRGFWAEFRMSPFGLLFSLFTAVMGFLWAAPGATVVSGMSEVDLPNWGRTSLAGPAANAGFAAVFYAGSIGLLLARSPFYGWLLVLAFVNAWFGTFNLLPFGPLDGAKVLRWSRAVWVVAILGIGAFAAVAALALYVYGTPFLGW
jgi:Zn-dependent protease